MPEQKLVFVTGYAQLDAKLRGLPANLQRKFVRGGLRKASKRLLQATKTNIREGAYETGAFLRSLTVRSMKRSRVRVGIALFTDRDKMYSIYEAKHGHKPHPAKGKSIPFFYPAAIEFGTDTNEAVSPMRRALYGSSEALRAYFVADVQQFIAENKVTTALPKVSK